MLRAHATHSTPPAGLARAPPLAPTGRARRAAASPRASAAAAPPPPRPRPRRTAAPPPHVAYVPGPTAVVAAPHAPAHAPHAPHAPPAHAHAHAEDAAALNPGAAAAPPPPVPADVLREFEHKLEADLASVGLTLMAVTGVIVFWRGVWSLLDYFMGDSLLGSLSCMVFGLSIVLWLRLSGARIATSFWPPG